MSTFGFQTRTGRGPSSICFNSTGSGQDLQIHQHAVCHLSQALPLPLVHDDEKAADNSTGRNVWVQLTYPCHEHGPSYTAEEPAYVGIYGSPYCFNVSTRSSRGG
jgi:hypothetical protein